MKAVLASLLFIVSIPAVFTTVHTTCYNYFLQKDGCVFSASDDRNRCMAPAKLHDGAVTTVSYPSKRTKRSGNDGLERRYDNPKPSFYVAGGTGNCGFYDTKTEIGVCLWDGAEQANPTSSTAGWLNSQKTSNCGKRVYIQRTNQTSQVYYAKVVDGCSFTATAPDPGCFQIAVTEALFNLFNPTDEERKALTLSGGLTWDFDNLNGQHSQQGPV